MKSSVEHHGDDQFAMKPIFHHAAVDNLTERLVTYIGGFHRRYYCNRERGLTGLHNETLSYHVAFVEPQQRIHRDRTITI